MEVFKGSSPAVFSFPFQITQGAEPLPEEDTSVRGTRNPGGGICRVSAHGPHPSGDGGGVHPFRGVRCLFAASSCPWRFLAPLKHCLPDPELHSWGEVCCRVMMSL